ncbi:TPA: restriction endonuclease subunit S [Salmonella enterica subsp. enterica serovar Vietnam]|nr:restriction endonuclease subunit S [Salmonella enterica]HAE8194413.1 restriction endonuclease subunit S [Salmonella enterica subsp. indica serovar 41:b:1,7]HAU3217205.1 restriction endonuclease subunit S [Salmonella enterica subsp. indica]
MSVDTLRETFHVNRIKPSALDDFLTAQTYRPEITDTYRKISTLRHQKLQFFADNKISQGPTPVYAKEGKPALKSKHTVDMITEFPEGDLVSPDWANQKIKHLINRNDLVITRKGSGTIGRASIFFEKISLNTDDSLFKVSLSKIDPAYVVSYLRSYQGERLLEKGVYGSTGQLSLSAEHIRNLPIYEPDFITQKYIGDKVRQAEKLRVWAKVQQIKIDQLLISDEYLLACKTVVTKTSRPQLADLSNRLDPKYYSNKAITVQRFTKNSGVLLSGLIKSISNGFEERNFVGEGVPYITVSEVSSGRLNVQGAPHIGIDVDVPAKAIIHECCVLVVRTGSIGTAIKVNALDKGAAISSHLIRLEFNDEETAAAVAVFLNSSLGKVLLHKISYGAVQPQIGQEELLALYIPLYVLKQKDAYLKLLVNFELAIRTSSQLIKSAKTLVESLIEGQLTEEQLVRAQQALDDGDTSLDRDILSKLSNEGYAVEEATPIFSDIDELYRLLESANETEEEE